VFCESEGKVFVFVFEPARVFVGVGVGAGIVVLRGFFVGVGAGIAVLPGSNRKREEVEEDRNFPSSKQRRFGKGWRSM